MIARRALSLSFILSFGALASLARGQTPSATLRGRVTDAQGAVLPGVTVTVLEVATNASRVLTTGDRGQYYVPNLPSGSYELSAELAGFTTARRSGLVLRVGQEITIDLVLEIGGIEEVVTVITETPILETTRSTLDTIIKKEDIDELPTVEREFNDLALLSPGVSLSGYPGGSDLSINGQRGFANGIYIDGATNEWQYYGQQASAFPQDWVQEFQVITNNSAAEFGTASGGILNVITRSGSNNWQGRVYGFFRNEGLDAAPFAGFFENGEPQFLDEPPPLSQQRIGAFLGGPVIRDKLFFFTGFESLNRDSNDPLGISEFWRAQSIETIVPTGADAQPFLLKGDLNFNTNHRLSVRFDRANKKDFGLSQFGGPIDTLEDRYTFGGPVWNLVANVSSAFGNNNFNEFRFFFGSNKPPIICNKSGTGGTEQLELAPIGTFAHIVYPGAIFGCPFFTGLEGEENLTFIDNFTMVRGAHEMKFGVQLAQVRTIVDVTNGHDGSWGFPSDSIFDQNNPATYPDQFTGNIGLIDERLNVWNAYFFFQDTWQVRDNLTLNLGIRYDLDRSMTMGNEFVDAKNQRFVDRFGGDPPLVETNVDTNNISPRFGFTWAPTASQKTLIRGSAGIFFDQNHNNFNAIYLANTLLADRFIVFDANDPFANPFDTPEQLRAFLATNYPFFPDFSQAPLLTETINRLDPDFQVPYTAQFSIGLAHDFGHGLTLEADYVNSRGEDLAFGIDDNVELVNGEVRQIDERFASVYTFSNFGWTRYNALQARADYQPGKGRLGVAYTLSKLTSNTATCIYGCTSTTNPFDFSEDEGPDDADRRNNLVIHGSYVFPLDIQLAGIWTYRSAAPFNVFTRFQLDDDPFDDRPEPRNSRRGDSLNTLDFRLSKIIGAGSHLNVTLFWEMFNAFNTDNFIFYEGNLESTSFGLPTGALEARRQQFGFRLDFF